MADPVYNADHVGEGIGRLAAQFKEKPRLAALATSYPTQVQDLESAFWQLAVDRAIDVAVGAQLDGLGKIVGQKRADLSDADYRVFIKARIRTNRSNGQIEQLITILLLLLGSSTSPVVREYYPASMVIEATGVTVDANVVHEQFLMKAKAAGVNLQFIYTSASAANVFTLGDVGGATTGGLGYGDTVAGLVGGVLSSVAG